MTPSEELTRRELEVLTLTATGAARREISELLSLSEETVKNHIDHACNRLRARNKTHAVALAMYRGIIAPFDQETPRGKAH